jgi:hypothetical protein
MLLVFKAEYIGERQVKGKGLVQVYSVYGRLDDNEYTESVEKLPQRAMPRMNSTVTGPSARNLNTQILSSALNTAALKESILEQHDNSDNTFAVNLPEAAVLSSMTHKEERRSSIKDKDDILLAQSASVSYSRRKSIEAEQFGRKRRFSSAEQQNSNTAADMIHKRNSVIAENIISSRAQSVKVPTVHEIEPPAINEELTPKIPDMPIITSVSSEIEVNENKQLLSLGGQGSGQGFDREVSTDNDDAGIIVITPTNQNEENDNMSALNPLAFAKDLSASIMELGQRKSIQRKDSHDVDNSSIDGEVQAPQFNMPRTASLSRPTSAAVRPSSSVGDKRRSLTMTKQNMKSDVAVKNPMIDYQGGNAPQQEVEIDRKKSLAQKALKRMATSAAHGPKLDSKPGSRLDTRKSVNQRSENAGLGDDLKAYSDESIAKSIIFVDPEEQSKLKEVFNDVQMQNKLHNVENEINFDDEEKQESVNFNQLTESERIAKFLLVTLASKGVQTGGSKIKSKTVKSTTGEKGMVENSHLGVIYQSLTPFLQFTSEELENRFQREYNEETWQMFLDNTMKSLVCQLLILILALLNVYYTLQVNLNQTGATYFVIGTVFAASGTQFLFWGMNAFQRAAGEGSPGLRMRLIYSVWSITTLSSILILVSFGWSGLSNLYLMVSGILPQMVIIHSLSMDGITFASKLFCVIFFSFGFAIFNMVVNTDKLLVPFIPLVCAILWTSIFSIKETSLKVEYLMDLILRTQSDLVKEEMIKSARVLKSILPQRIIVNLLTDPSSGFFEEFKMITVLHMDIAGYVFFHPFDLFIKFPKYNSFTAMSSTMEPLHIIKMLNTLFVYVDRLTEDFHVEKICTIGDAYVACSTLSQTADPKISAISVCIVALQMQQFVVNQLNNSPMMRRKLRQKISMRIGCHTGPCYGAIMGGNKNFRYDLMGDTGICISNHTIPFCSKCTHLRLFHI